MSAYNEKAEFEVALDYIVRSMEKILIYSAALRGCKGVPGAVSKDLSELHNDLDVAREMFVDLHAQGGEA